RPIQWPVPQKLTEEGLTTYIYTGTVILLVPLRLSKDLAPGKLDLRAAVSWLECEKQCLPGSGNIQGNLNIGRETKASTHAARIETARLRLPKDGTDLHAAARWDGPPG